MSVPPDLDRLIDAMAPTVGLEIAEAHREGIQAFLAVAAGMAEIVARVPLDDRLDLAAVFRPVEP